MEIKLLKNNDEYLLAIKEKNNDKIFEFEKFFPILENAIKIRVNADVEVLDLNGDGLKDLIAVPDLNTSIGINSWLYVFLGSEKGFSNIPYTSKETLIDQESLRPTSLTLVPDEASLIAVSFGAPIRGGVVFNLSINDKKLVIKKIKQLKAPIIENGYSPVYIGSFSSSIGDHLSLISVEGNKIKVTLFNPDKDYEISHSGSYSTVGAQSIISSGIKKQTLLGKLDEEGLIIPFQTGPKLLLILENDKLSVTPFKKSSKKLSTTQNKNVLSEIEEIRQNLENEKLSINNKKIKDLVRESVNFENINLKAPKKIVQENLKLYQKKTVKIIQTKSIIPKIRVKPEANKNNNTPSCSPFNICVTKRTQSIMFY